jgi:hypothetical protein
MINLRLMGGLGNQMFQYAFGRTRSIITNAHLKLDESLLLHRTELNEVVTYRDPQLALFPNLKYKKASILEIKKFNEAPSENVWDKISRKINYFIGARSLIIQEKNLIKPEYFKVLNNVCYVGRWQSYRFFESHERQIREDFYQPLPEINGIEDALLVIANCTSVCLHVRRGDLVSSSLYSKEIGVINDCYYKRAIAEMLQGLPDAVFFVFSDDVEWCRQSPLFKNMNIVGNELSGVSNEGHFYLMRSCRHFIISNSTYAWWAAYLSEGKNKKVIAPARWYLKDEMNNTEMSPEDWIRI